MKIKTLTVLLMLEVMKCSVLVFMIAACVKAATGAVAPCSMSQEFFARYNASADDSDGPGAICGGQCCGRGRETQLRIHLRKLAERRAIDATRPVVELLLSTQRTLRDHLTSLSHQSQNKTAVLFAQIYKGHAARTQPPLSALYEDIRTTLRPITGDLIGGEELGTPPPTNLVMSAKRFFQDIFPVAYHNILRLNTKQFTPEYERCLKEAYDAVQPFGEVPQNLGTSLSRSLEAARALLQVLAVGAGALTASEQLLTRANDHCSNMLFKAAACGRCRGYDAKPCKNYCLNVARGCVGSLVVELDAPWSSYVEGVERVTHIEADTALRDLDKLVSDAIMHAIENKQILEKKVRTECDAPSTVEGPEMSGAQSSFGTRRESLRAPPMDVELLQFAASLANKKKLFTKLADRLCDEPDLSDYGNEQCWNGDAIGEYSKPLVPSVSLSDQKYNPEVSEAPHDSKVSAIGDKLIQARQSLMGCGLPVAEPFMQGDEAGEEGSGSGRSYDDDTDFDAEEGSGEGSGDQTIGPRILPGVTAIDTSTPKTKAAFSSRPLQSITICLAVTVRLICRFT